MQTTSKILLALATLTSVADRADACTLPAGTVHKYWSQPGVANDDRCSFYNGGYHCHLSGWLYAPPTAPNTNNPAIVFVHGSGGNWSDGGAFNQNGGCEMISYFVSQGYVVFNPLMRGIADRTNGATPAQTNSATAAGFVNTGEYVVDHALAEADPSSPNRPIYTWSLNAWGVPSPTQTDYVTLTTLEYMEDELEDVDNAIQYLVGLPGKTGTGHLVDSTKIALSGHSYGGATVTIGSAYGFTTKPRVVVDLSGAALSWNSSVVWNNVLTYYAKNHQQPLAARININESSTGTYEPGVAIYNAANSTGQARLDKYDSFTLTSTELAACTAAGYGTNQCYHIHFQTDAAQVARWAPDVRQFLINKGM